MVAAHQAVIEGAVVVILLRAAAAARLARREGLEEADADISAHLSAVPIMREARWRRRRAASSKDHAMDRFDAVGVRADGVKARDIARLKDDVRGRDGRDRAAPVARGRVY